MKVKTVVRNAGDLASKMVAKQKKFSAAPVISPEQKVIDETVKKADTIRKELKVLSEQMKLPVDQRTPELFQKYGKLVSEEPVQEKIDLLGELDDKGLEKVVDSIIPTDLIFPGSREDPDFDVFEQIISTPEDSVEEEEVSTNRAVHNLVRSLNKAEKEEFDGEISMTDIQITFPLAWGNHMPLTNRPTLRDIKKKTKSSTVVRVLLDKENYMIVGYHNDFFPYMKPGALFQLIRQNNKAIYEGKYPSIKSNKDLYSILNQPQF